MGTKLSNFFNFRHAHLRHFLISALLPIIALFITLSVYYTNQALVSQRASNSDMMDTAVSVINANLSEMEYTSFTPYLYNDISQAMIYMQNGYMHADANPSSYLKIAELETNYTMLFTKLLHTSRQKVISIAFYPFGNGYGGSYTITRSTAGLQYAEVDTALVESMYEIIAPYETIPVFLQMESSEKGTYTLLRVIRDMDARKDLGILRIDTNSNALIECMNSVTVSPNSCLLLLDSQGNQVYSIGEAAPELVEMALNGETSGNLGQSFFEFQVRSVHGCHLIHIYSVNDILGSFSGSFAIILMVVLLAFVATFLLFRRQSEDTISSVEAILEAIRQLQKGNRNYVCRVSSESEEYRIIADALNEMGQQLQSLIEAEAVARDSQSRAEFLALQSQINPHFLYNTLNGFIALNRMGERKQLETSLFQLTKLFRHICNSSDTVTVEQEYSFASQYLELQKLRFDERIEYKMEVEENTRQMTIPKLAIQPIVENCIVHGMEASDGAIEITLRAYLQDEPNQLVLEVSDTGVGFDTSTLEDSPRVGLKNVLTRLQIFRKESRYEIDSAPGKGTTVRLLIPMEQEENHEDPAD